MEMDVWNARRLAWVGWMLAVSGCSLFVSGPPPRTVPPGPVECTRSRVLPVLDLVATGVVLVLAYGAADFDGVDCTPEDPCADGFDTGIFLGGAAIGAVFGAAGIWGLQKTAACEERGREYDAFMRDTAPLGPR
jgi:hypothetical protein